MSLDSKLKRRLAAALNVVDEQAGTKGPRLVDDATRLWNRVQKFVALAHKNFVNSLPASSPRKGKKTGPRLHK